MRIGIGISLNSNAREAALAAVGQARQAVSEPTLAVVFGSIRLQQDQVYAGLLEAGLDPLILFGGSSYAEISPAGVTYKSIAVLLVELPEATIRTVSVPLQDDPQTMSRVLLDALDDWQPDVNCLNVGLLLSEMSAGRANEMLASLRQRLSQLAVFGGMSCGNYDLGMSHPEFWTNYQYCSGALQLEETAGPRTTVKTPVKIDHQAGCMTFYPVENLQGRRVYLIQANRKSLIAGTLVAKSCLCSIATMTS